jgi:flagellar hook-length control protein FliK
VHNLIAAIAATPQPDPAPKAGVTASDAGSFRDVLCAKVVGQSQARATSSGTKPEVGDSRVQGSGKTSEKLGNHDASLVKARGLRSQDNDDPLAAAAPSSTATPQLPMTPGQAKTAIALGNGAHVIGANASSHIMGVLPSDTSAGTATGAQFTAIAMVHPDGETLSNAQPANQSQTKTAIEDGAPSLDGSQAFPISPASIGAPEPVPTLFPGMAAPGDASSPLDALGHPPGTRQKTDRSDQSPLPSAACTATPDRRDLPLRDQSANSSDGGAENPTASVTLAPAASASQADAAANIFLETNPALGPPGAQSLNPSRKTNTEEPGLSRTNKKEDRNPAPSSQPATGSQPESPQTMPVKAGQVEPTPPEVFSVAAGVGHNLNSDRTVVTAAVAGPDTAGGPTSHASPGSPGGSSEKAPGPFPAAGSDMADTTAAATPMLQSARVLERMGQIEIRVGLNTANFGNLELHTTVNQDRVAATLATSHSELRAALAAEMPSLERAMAQQQLTLDSFHLDTHAGAQDGNHGAPGDQQNRSRTWTGDAESGAASDGSRMPEMASQLWIGPDSSGLNVHA